MTQDLGRSPADAGSGCQPSASAADASSQSSIPNAFAPFAVLEEAVTTKAIADAADALANESLYFKASALGRYLLPDCGGRQRLEATNRLMQRWRKMGLAEYSSRGWRLTRGSWERLQASAIEARRAETQGGSVHESASPEGGDAQ